MQMDYVGRLFSDVEKELTFLGVPFTVKETKPASRMFFTDPTNLYVIRQQMIQSELTLTVAAKMGKEVS